MQSQSPALTRPGLLQIALRPLRLVISQHRQPIPNKVHPFFRSGF